MTYSSPRNLLWFGYSQQRPELVGNHAKVILQNHNIFPIHHYIIKMISNSPARERGILQQQAWRQRENCARDNSVTDHTRMKRCLQFNSQQMGAVSFAGEASHFNCRTHSDDKSWGVFGCDFPASWSLVFVGITLFNCCFSPCFTLI